MRSGRKFGSTKQKRGRACLPFSNTSSADGVSTMKRMCSRAIAIGLIRSKDSRIGEGWERSGNTEAAARKVPRHTRSPDTQNSRRSLTGPRKSTPCRVAGCRDGRAMFTLPLRPLNTIPTLRLPRHSPRRVSIPPHRRPSSHVRCHGEQPWNTVCHGETNDNTLPCATGHHPSSNLGGGCA